MKLRPYQVKSVDSTIEAWDSSRSTLLVLPTGCGKTVVFASLIKRMLPGRAMILAHRQELIWQARDKIRAVAGIEVDVEMGEHKAHLDRTLFHPRASAIVSTVQTHVAGGDGGGRIGKFNPTDFKLLIIDEAHHATSPSYRRIIDYYMTNPDLVVLGVTATPDRGDEEALGQVFGSVAFDYEILDAIRDGWLVPIDQQMISIDSLDFSGVRTTAGDLNGSDLAAVMEAEKNLHGIASATIDIVGSRRGIGFASSVSHANTLASIFNRHRPGMAAAVSAGTDKDSRKQIISDFALGKIQWLWNCGVFTEGFDDSGVEVISMARPTKSRSLYAQMSGRATRVHESIARRIGEYESPALRRSVIQRSVKPSCLIIDFVGNCGKHKLITTADILGGNVSEDVIREAESRARKSGKPVRMDKEIEDEEKRQEEMRQRRLQEEARKARLVAKTSYSKQAVDPFSVLDVRPNEPRGWDKGKVLTEKQRGILRKQGYDPDKMDFARAKQLVGIIIDRWTSNKCSIKQAATLEKFGFTKSEASRMTFQQASFALDAISKNGWKRPAGLEIPKSNPVDKKSETLSDEDVPF